MAILFVTGVNDRSLMGMNLDERGNLVYLMDGNCSIHHRLPLLKDVGQSFLLFGPGVMQRMIQSKRKPSLIFNQIADPDTHKGALERCIELCDHLDTAVINHPKHVLRTSREQVSMALQGIPGVVMPRSWRFQPRSPDEVLAFAAEQGVAFPFITRVAGMHNGKNMVRVDHKADYAELHALPFDGRDFYLSEYIDYADGEGLYHKQRIVVIDGQPLLRHALYLDHWMVHGESRAFMMERETWESDIARFDRLSNEVLPTLRPAIDEITSRLQLEYYGIDCNFRPDGQMLIFEANANMNVLHSPNPAFRYRVKEIESQLYRTLSKYSGERVI
jgi:glutathione synthase/RimK-type ligase-like ATP-grasp enzyme